MSVINYHFFYTRDELSHELSATVGKTLDAACTTRGSGVFIAAGGNTPIAAYRKLGRLALSWDKITVMLTDERMVSADHPDSNEAMLRRELLHAGAAKAHLISLVGGDGIPETTEEVEMRLQTLYRPSDVVMLGMGNDGHIASLIPGADGLAEAVDPASGRLCRLVNSKSSGHPRITLTARALLQTRRLILLFFGYRKRGVFERALGGRDILDKPVRILLNQKQVPLDVYWAP